MGLVEFYRNRMSSNPRDMVFGLMPLSANTTIQARYDHNLARVYCDLVTSHIKEHKILSSLLRADEGSSRRRGLPTWVPDWSARVSDVDEEMLRFVRIFNPLYNACGPRNVVSSFDINTTTLGLKGILVDKISEVGPGHGPDDCDVTDMQLILACKQLCLRKRHQRNRYKKAEHDFEHDFWRLTCLDVCLTPAAGGGDTLRRTTLADYQDFQSQNAQPAYSFEEPWIWRIHRFFVTKKGFIGWAPRSVEVGDKVYVFPGGNYPFVLRPSIVPGPDALPAATRMHTFIGHCYVQGLMDGEAMMGVKDEDLNLVYII